MNEDHARPPAWQQQSLSWKKLEDVERWLESPAADVAPYWRVEGQLVLSEGRVQFTRRDLAGPSGRTDVLDGRMDLARSGFQEVLRDPDASPSQSDRARRGLSTIDNLTSSVARPARAASTGDIVPRSAWGARSGIASRLDPATVPYRRITVHHTAMGNAPVLDGSFEASARELRRIQSSQLNGGKFGDIAYHYLIDPSGRVFEGRQIHLQGAHAGGDNNIGNIGVCLIGNFDTERPTPAALAALESLVDALQSAHGLARHAVEPHSHYGGTNCPGEHLEPFIRSRW